MPCLQLPPPPHAAHLVRRLPWEHKLPPPHAAHMVRRLPCGHSFAMRRLTGCGAGGGRSCRNCWGCLRHGAKWQRSVANMVIAF